MRTDRMGPRGHASSCVVMLARVLTMLLLMAVWTSPPAVWAQQRGYQVLVLNSYHQGLVWTDRLVEGVISVLKDETRNPLAAETEVYVENLDALRTPFDSRLDALWFAFLASKYPAVDVVLVSDDVAYNFLLAHADALFPDVPIVFCGVSPFSDTDFEVLPRLTGVVAQPDVAATLELALSLHPGTHDVWVVNDSSIMGQMVERGLEEARAQFAGRVTFRTLVDPSPSDLRGLGDLPPGSVVLLGSLIQGEGGRLYTFDEAAALVAGLAASPVYVLWDVYLGAGAVGGKVVSAELQGERAAELAVQVLTGTSVERLPVLRESPNPYIFDFDALRRFEIRQGRLSRLVPATPDLPMVILNRPPSFLESYGLTLGLGLGMLVLGGGVLAYQGWRLRQRRQVEQALRAESQVLEEARVAMEVQVQTRTAELKRRSEQFQIAAAVAREAAEIRDLHTLLDTVVAMVAARFGFYHVGIFLIDDTREYAVLRAVSSEGGRAMLARGHRLRVGRQGIVGYVAGQGEPRIALDVGADEVWVNTKELSATRSEMALPVKYQGEVIGVLDVQSDQPGAFGQEDIEVLTIVADQVAVAIQNARLFEESRQAMARLEAAYDERITDLWRRLTVVRGFLYDGLELQPLERASGMSAAGEHGGEDGRLVVPIQVRNQVVGEIVLERDLDVTGPWRPEERALAANIGVQAGLALEGARLLMDSQLRAERERVLGQVTSRMRQALDMDLILQVALREIAESLDLSGVEVRMASGVGDPGTVVVSPGGDTEGE